MSETNYTYAVARVRAKEVSLFSDSVIEQLMACKDYKSCMAFLHDHGWGNGEPAETEDDMLAFERKKTWDDIHELVNEKDAFTVITVPREYHNLKAAIKQVCSGDKAEHAYYDNCRWSPEQLKDMVERKDFDSLPEMMAYAANEATEALLQTQDGQLCDIIIDTATLEAVKEEGAKSDSKLIKQYAEEMVAVANIRVAVRCAKTKKSKDFMERAIVACDSLSKASLIKGAESGIDGICSYLQLAGYSEAAEHIKESPSAFERWCDNRIIDKIKEEKYNSFSAGPILAYFLARENEIKTVRIILTGKLNNLSDDFIRERLRKMYV